MKSPLIAWGCSFTWGVGLDSPRPGFRSQPSRSAWPQLAADHWGVPVKNLAQPGASNLWIADQIINYEFTGSEQVAVMWTWPQRTTRNLRGPTLHSSASTRPEHYELVLKLWTDDDLTRIDQLFRTAARLCLESRGISYCELDVLEPQSSWADLPTALDHSHPGHRWHERIRDRVINCCEAAQREKNLQANQR